jgi:hypothetical protein
MEYDEGDVRDLIPPFFVLSRTPEHNYRPGKSKKRGSSLLVNTEAINDKAVFYEYITPQAKAPGHFNF